MKRFKGIGLKVMCRGFSKVFEGKMVADARSWIVLEPKAKTAGEKTPRVRVIKANMVGFIPENEPERPEAVPIFVYGCRNPGLNCPGVKALTVDRKPGQTDVRLMMEDCPKVCDSCKARVYGELDELPPKVLAAMLDGTIYGDYPEEDEE